MLIQEQKDRCQSECCTVSEYYYCLLGITLAGILKESAWLFKQTGIVPSYLHEHFQAVQGSCTGSGHGTCTSTCNQMSPPHPRLPLFHCELIRDGQILSDIKDLQKCKVLRNILSAGNLAKALLLFISAKCWSNEYAHSESAAYL